MQGGDGEHNGDGDGELWIKQGIAGEIKVYKGMMKIRAVGRVSCTRT